jgi:energy-coupling factor transporter ATP-binding protein EcfA2
MIESVELNNFGPIADFAWRDLAPINLVIGRNGTGKTFLLKALYCALRALEEKRGDEPMTSWEILEKKLFWTFQYDNLGDLVRSGSAADLSAKIMLRWPMFPLEPAKPLVFLIPQNAKRGDVRFENQAIRTPNYTSIFIPAKEVLSLHNVILRTRRDLRLFGFDDTYLDLVDALSYQPDVLDYPQGVAQPMSALHQRVGGRADYDLVMTPSQGIPIPQSVWRFRVGDREHAIGLAAEGARKLAVLDRLLRNRQLRRGSILFVDEPESTLHPEAITAFLDVLYSLVEAFDGDIQIFLASHSYFVVKKLYLIAQENGISIPVAMAEGDGWETADLKDGMPSNPIIDESIRLYKEEVDLVLK